MQKSDLLLIFLSFSDEELRNARKFLQSPYFNKREDVLVLFDFLAKEKKKSKPNWTKENVFSAIQKDKKTKYDDAIMRHTMSYLLQLLYQFLSLQTWEKDLVRQELDLHKSLKIKNLDKVIEKKSDEIFQLIESENLRNAEHHFQKYLWQLERYAYIHRRRRTGDMHLREMSEEFSIYYFSEMLRQACLLFSHQTFNKESYDFSFFDEILVWVKNKNLEKTLAIAVYFHSYLSMKNPEEDEHFFELKRLLTENWAAFQLDEIRDLYLIAINFCIKRQNKGQEIFIREGFELYRTGIDNEILLENGVLSVFTYKNVHLLADKLGEYEWIVDFLEKYKNYLPAEQRENHYKLNLAQYYFRRRQYNKAMPILQTVEFSDVLHNLDARRMLLIMYYDLGEFTVLDALLESFKTYTTRQTQLDYHRESYLNLIKFVKKLLFLPSMNKQEKEQFVQDIKDCASLAERNWLLEQVN